jgi:hypothetical protein
MSTWTTSSMHMHMHMQVPAATCLHPLLRALLRRFICLMAGTAGSTSGCCSSSTSGSPPDECGVLAHRYGAVLLELLGGVLACTGHLQDAFGVEVHHLMAVPQVQARLAAAAARGCAAGSGVLTRLNLHMLRRVLAAVGAAVPEARERPQQQAARLQDARVRMLGTVLKVQN